MARRTRAGEYTPTRGPAKGQTYPSESAYRRAAKGYSEPLRRERLKATYGTPSRSVIATTRRNADRIGYPRSRLNKLVKLLGYPSANEHLKGLRKAAELRRRGRPTNFKPDPGLPTELNWYHDTIGD